MHIQARIRRNGNIIGRVIYDDDMPPFYAMTEPRYTGVIREATRQRGCWIFTGRRWEKGRIF